MAVQFYRREKCAPITRRERNVQPEKSAQRANKGAPSVLPVRFSASILREL